MAFIGLVAAPILLSPIAGAAVITVDDTGTFSSGFNRLPGGIFTYTTAELGGFDITGSDKLVVAFSGENHGSGVTSITFGGVALQEAVTSTNSQRVAHIWFLDNPSANGDLVIDMVQSNANGVGGSIFGLSNTTVGFAATGTSLNSASASITVTANDSLVVAAAVNNSSGNPPSPTTPLTLLASVDSGSSGHGSGYQQVALSGTGITPTFGGDTVFAVAAVEFQAIPEPSLLMLSGLGLLTLGWRRRRA